MAYIQPEIVAEARKVDLLSYLKATDPSELVRFVFILITISRDREVLMPCKLFSEESTKYDIFLRPKVRTTTII